MKLTNNDIKTMVLECIKSLTFLNEAKAIDVYTRYYADSIPKEWWDEMTKGTENITPFHRKVADSIKKYWAACDKDSEGTKEYLFNVCKLAQEAWNSSITAQQFLTNAAREDYYKFDASWLESFLRQVKLAKNYSENEFIDKGLFKIYEDNKLLVTCTLSYSASHRYYGDSHWCTSSDIAGEYNGFEMFKNYTVEEYSDSNESAILVQFVDKQNREGSYQIQVYSPGLENCGQICDFADNPHDIDAVEDHFGRLRVRLAGNNIKKNFSELSNITLQYVASEDGYYNLREYVFISHRIGALREKIQSPNILAAMTYDYNHREEQQSGSFMFYPQNDSTYGKNFLCTVSFKVDDNQLGNGAIDPEDDDWDDDHDFDDDYDEEEEEREEKQETRPVGKKYFTPEEQNLIKRATMNRSFRFDDVGQALVLFKREENGTSTALKVLGNGYWEELKGRVAEISSRRAGQWFYGFIDMMNGNLLYQFATNSNFQTMNGWQFLHGNDNNFYIVSYPNENELKLMAIIDGETAEVTKFNKPLARRNTEGWGSPLYYVQ